jgi:hypothetical protein
MLPPPRGAVANGCPSRKSYPLLAMAPMQRFDHEITFHGAWRARFDLLLNDGNVVDEAFCDNAQPVVVEAADTHSRSSFWF